MISAWWRLTRAEHAVMVFIAVSAAQLVTLNGDFNAINWFAGVGPALVTLASFALNDYLDLRSDKALKRKDRPLVSGELKPAWALNAAAVFFVLGCALSWLVSPTAFAIVAVYSLLAVAYDAKLKKMPLIGNAFIASAMSVSFLYGNIVVSPALNYFVLLFTVISFVSGLGRELIITLRDVKGDRKIGATTLPMLIGRRWTVILASALLHVAAALSVLPLFQEIFLPYVALVGVSDALFLFAAWTVSLSPTDASLKKARNYTLAALMFGIAAFASLAFA